LPLATLVNGYFADTHSRPYGYSSPRRGQYNAPFPNARRAPPDPHTFDYPASLKQYAEWFRYYYPQQAIDEDNADKAAEAEAGDGTRPRNGIKTKWEKYKKDFSATQASPPLLVLTLCLVLRIRLSWGSCIQWVGKGCAEILHVVL
jgi:hypothetical protein